MNLSSEVSTILHELGLDEYIEAFKWEGIYDENDVGSLNDQDMKELGLRIGERNRLWTYIRAHQNGERGTHSSSANSRPTSKTCAEATTNVIVDKIFQEGQRTDLDALFIRSQQMEKWMNSDECSGLDLGTVREGVRRCYQVLVDGYSIPPFDTCFHDDDFDTKRFQNYVAMGMKPFIDRINSMHGLALTPSRFIHDRLAGFKAYKDVHFCMDDAMFGHVPSFVECKCDYKSIYDILFTDGISERAVFYMYVMNWLAKYIDDNGDGNLISCLDESRFSVERIVSESLRIYRIICHRRAHQIAKAASSLSDTEIDDLVDFGNAAGLIASALAWSEDKQMICFVNPSSSQVDERQKDSSKNTSTTAATAATAGIAAAAAAAATAARQEFSIELAKNLTTSAFEVAVEAGCCTIL